MVAVRLAALGAGLLVLAGCTAPAGPAAEPSPSPSPTQAAPAPTGDPVLEGFELDSWYIGVSNTRDGSARWARDWAASGCSPQDVAPPVVDDCADRVLDAAYIADSAGIVFDRPGTADFASHAELASLAGAYPLAQDARAASAAWVDSYCGVVAKAECSSVADTLTRALLALSEELGGWQTP